MRVVALCVLQTSSKSVRQKCQLSLIQLFLELSLDLRCLESSYCFIDGIPAGWGPTPEWLGRRLKTVFPKEYWCSYVLTIL